MSRTTGVYQTLRAQGITLPPAPADSPYFSITRPFGGNLLYVSGCGPMIEGEKHFFGTLPSHVSVEDGRRCARHCALNIISALDAYTGDLNRVKSIVKLLVYVSSDPGFSEQHLVAHGASGLLLEVFGEAAGKATRSAIGVAALPLDFPVEVEAVVELE